MRTSGKAAPEKAFLGKTGLQKVGNEELWGSGIYRGVPQQRGKQGAAETDAGHQNYGVTGFNWSRETSAWI